MQVGQRKKKDGQNQDTKGKHNFWSELKDGICRTKAHMYVNGSCFRSGNIIELIVITPHLIYYDTWLFQPPVGPTMTKPLEVVQIVLIE